jgi:hypothetical protein
VRKWERAGRIPPRDATLFGRPVWKRETIEQWLTAELEKKAGRP